MERHSGKVQSHMDQVYVDRAKAVKEEEGEPNCDYGRPGRKRAEVLGHSHTAAWLEAAPQVSRRLIC